MRSISCRFCRASLSARCCFSLAVRLWQKFEAFLRITTLAARSVASRSGMRERRNSKALRRSTRRWRSIELCWERFSQLSSESDPARDPLDLRGDLPEDPPSLESVAADRGLFCLEGSDELFRDETSDLTDLVVEAATAN